MFCVLLYTWLKQFGHSGSFMRVKVYCLLDSTGPCPVHYCVHITVFHEWLSSSLFKGFIAMTVQHLLPKHPPFSKKHQLTLLPPC